MAVVYYEYWSVSSYSLWQQAFAENALVGVLQLHQSTSICSLYPVTRSLITIRSTPRIQASTYSTREIERRRGFREVICMV